MNKEEVYLIIFWQKSGLSMHQATKLVEEAGYECSLTTSSMSKDKQLEFIKRLYFKSVTDFEAKIERVGLDSFVLGIVKDKTPNYGLMTTTRGYSHVNRNIIFLKRVLRSFSKIPDGIHISDSIEESRHNLFVALSVPYEKVLSSFPKFSFDPIALSNIEAVFQLLNESIPYVVQRNFYAIFDKSSAKYGDIDILVEDVEEARLLLGLKGATEDSTRRKYVLPIENKLIKIEVRAPDCGYYDPQWATRILQNRIKSDSGGFYIPCDQDLFYMVAYHALFHKFDLKEDYLSFLEKFSREKTDKQLTGWSEILNSLSRFLKKNKFKVSIPKDKTVKLNPFNFFSSGIKDDKNFCREDFLPEHHARNFVNLILKDPYVIYQKANRLSSVKVLSGKTPPLNRLVVKIVKVKDVTLAPYILSEHKMLKLFGNYFAPKLLSYFLDGGFYFLLMERLSGVTLDVAIKYRAPLLIAHRERITSQLRLIANTLKEKKIKHRDIRENNIFINSSAELKIIDFGLACSELDSFAPLPAELANSGDDTLDILRIINILSSLTGTDGKKNEFSSS